MTVLAPPVDLPGNELDMHIAVVQALVDGTSVVVTSTLWTADAIQVYADSLYTADGGTPGGRNVEERWWYEQLLNQLQVEAVDHYMVTGWLNAARILATFPVAVDDVIGQALQQRVTDLTAFVAHPPSAAVLAYYRQALYAAQITLVEHLMDHRNESTAALILSTMTGVQSFPFEYSSNSVVLPGVPASNNFPVADHNNGVGYPPGGVPIVHDAPAGPVIVPGEVGLTQAQALADFAAVGLVMTVAGSQYDAVNPAGSVSQQFPVTGTIVLSGSSVVATLSLGAQAMTYVVGGTLTGLLSGSVVLQNNGGDDLTLTADGPFAFATELLSGRTYAVTVLTQPAGQTCVVANGTGTVASADIASIGVANTPNTYSIGGTLSGYISGSVVLQNNGGDNTTVAANGTFTFPTKVASGAAYAVTVLSKPTGQSVALSSATGTVAAANVTNVGAAVSLNSYTIGGTVSGLTGTLVLQNNGGDNLTLTVNGPFTFATPVASGAAYLVTVLTQPAGQTCTLSTASGTVAGANVTNVSGVCNPPNVYSIGGTLTGLSASTSVVLQNNAGDNLTVSANGAFTFATKLPDLAAYAVTVLTQPVGQTVAITSGSGSVAAADVTTVAAASSQNTYTVGGTLSGLIDGSVVLQNNGGDNLTVSANGAFTFATPVAHASAYAVTVLTQPSGQTVVLSATSGTMAAANVTDVGAVSTANTYSIGGTLSGLLDGSVTLRNNGGNALVLTANGPFTFTTKIAHASGYAVTVGVQPVGQTVALSGTNGFVVAADVTSVVATSTPKTYTVGGTLSGLVAGGSVVLQNNGADDLTVSANGAFTFATPIAHNAAYAVTVKTPPSGQTVALTNATGTIGAANVTNVGAACTTAAPPVRRFAPGVYAAISYANRGLGPSANAQSADTGTYPAYAAGTATVPLTIPSGSYSNGTIPGGHLGTGTVSGVNGGSALVRNTHGPCINTNATHRVQGLVVRYPWNDIETSKDTYDFVGSHMDADLAQCIALKVMWFPIIVMHTFAPAESSGLTSADPKYNTPVPAYLAAYSGPGSGGTAIWRWDLTNVNPRAVALITKISQRYDLCPYFGGICTQETTTSNQDSVAHNYTAAGYLTALQAESDAHATASPNSRHLAFQNFIATDAAGGANTTQAQVDKILDQYAAYILKNGAILAGPDLVLSSSSGVYARCYTSGSNTPQPHAGRYSGYHFGGTIGSGVNFGSTGGRTGCSIQRAEWIGIGPAVLAAAGGQSIANALNYGKGSITVGPQPNFLNLDVVVMDWHTNTGDGVPSYNGAPQSFFNAGVAMINSAAAAIPFGTFTAS